MQRWLSESLSVVRAPFRSINSRRLGAAARLHPPAIHRCPPAVGLAWGLATSGKSQLCHTAPSHGVAPAVPTATGTCQPRPREPAGAGLRVCKYIIYYFYYPSPLFIV